jgi:serine/threonine protein kinase
LKQILEGLKVSDYNSIKFFFKQFNYLLLIFKYIHDEELVHGNLKPENFIFENDNYDGQIKLTDIALYPLLGTDLLKYALTSSAQYCGIYLIYFIFKNFNKKNLN